MALQKLLRKEFPKQREWAGKWIWLKNSGTEENSFYFFRKEFHLSSLNENYKLYITAESKYRLFVNGVLVGDGAPMSQPFFKYYDVRDMNSFLKTGDNCISVLVYNYGRDKELKGGLLAELTDGSGKTAAATDKTWKAVRAEAWNKTAYYFSMNMDYPYQEFYDNARYPHGWDMPGFDVSSWQPVEILTSYSSDNVNVVLPWSLLVQRDIPYMRETYLLPKSIYSVEESLSIASRKRSDDLSVCLSAPGLPLKYSLIKDEDNLLSNDGFTVVQNSTNHQDGIFDGIYDPCIILDFGKVITAYVELEIEGTRQGTVDIGYAERLIDGYFNNAIECSFAARLTMKEGRQTFRTFAWRGFRYLKLRFGRCFQEVKLYSVKALETTYPFENKGAFTSNDTRTNSIYDISRNTIALCSNEFLMDTPWREQGQWLGDVSAVTLGGIYSCYGDTLLAAKFLKQSGACQHPTGLLENKTNILTYNWYKTIPDYSFWWVMALWKHYMYTGEDYWIQHYYPHVTKILQTILNYIGDNGLISNMPYWIFIDWANLEKRGEGTALNALFYGMLETVAKMAAFKKDAYIEELVSEAMEGIKSNFMKRLYDPERGCFADAYINDGFSSEISENANMAAIYWGLCDKETALAIIDKFYLSKSIKYTEAQPFFTMVVLKALEKAGRFDLAMKIVGDRWGSRMVDRGATSCFEEWTINGSWRTGNFEGYLRTLSHAWSAYPAEFLTSNMIGLEIVDPGCSKIRLAPKKTGLDYDIKYPLPQGIILVSCKGDEISIELPVGVELV